MPILTPDDYKIPIPQFRKVKQVFDSAHIQNLEEKLLLQLDTEEIRGLLKGKKKIAIAVGSRGVSNLPGIVATLIGFLKRFDLDICIIPAMGSHGGATAEGQREVLGSLGISEAGMGVPVKASMEVLQIGETRDGVPVYFDKVAAESDLVIPVNRVKPHTDYKSEIESGLCKMLAIGLGNHVGCSRLHQLGFEAFGRLIPAVSTVILNKIDVGFGIAVVENAYEDIKEIEVIKKGDIPVREKELLRVAKENISNILIKEPLDILIVQEIGKEISGGGMDPNIVGRTTKGYLQGFEGPRASRLIVLNLTRKTHGNGLGIGLADFTLEQTVNQLDKQIMNTNAVASGNPESARCPIALKDEEEAILAAFKCIPGCDVTRPRIIRIKNTLDLEYIEVSEALLACVDSHGSLELISD